MYHPKVTYFNQYGQKQDSIPTFVQIMASTKQRFNLMHYVKYASSNKIAHVSLCHADKIYKRIIRHNTCNKYDNNN